METNIYNEILKLFIGENGGIYNKPFLKGDKVIATDCYGLVAFDKNLINCSKIFEPGITLPFFPVEQKFEKMFSYEEVQKWIDEVPIEIRERGIECEECEGDGIVSVEYYSAKRNKSYNIDCECPICEGSGFEMNEIIKEKSPYFRIDIGLSTFYSKQIERVFKVMTMQGNANLILTRQDEAMTPSYFKINDIELIVMPISKYCLK